MTALGFPMALPGRVKLKGGHEAIFFITKFAFLGEAAVAQ